MNNEISYGMRNFSILKLAFAIIAAMGILHFVAGAFYLYWTLPWWDYLMHFLGGLGGGLVIVWLVSDKNISGLSIVLLALFCVMIVGGVWEIFEYVNGIAGANEGYGLDTFHDLAMDALGALLAGFVGLRKIRNARS